MEFTPHGFLGVGIWLISATQTGISAKNREFIAFIANKWGLKEQKTDLKQLKWAWNQE